MPETMPQAVELAQLVELEARWENLPHASTNSTRELVAKQSAYEAYRSRRVAYHRQYAHPHPRVPGPTPLRPGGWAPSPRHPLARAGGGPASAGRV